MRESFPFRMKNINFLSRAKSFGLTVNSIVTVMILSVVSTVAEVFGIGIFLPIFQFIRLEGDIAAMTAESKIWEYAVIVFSYLGITPSLAILLVLAFILFSTRQLLNYFKTFYVVLLKQNLIKLQRNKIFNAYIEAKVDYYDKNPIGVLVNIVMIEINAAVAGLIAPINLAVSTIVLTAYLILLFLLSWEMTLFAIGILAVMFQVPKIWVVKSKTNGRKLVDANTKMSEFLISRLRSPRLVRLSGTELKEDKEYSKLISGQRKYHIKGSILRLNSESSIEPIVIGLSLVFLYFSYTVFHLQVDIIGLYLVIILRLMPIVKGSIMEWQSLQGVLGSIEALEGRFYDMEKSREIDLGTEDVKELNGPLSFNHVGYCYAGCSNYAIRDINFTINENKMTAIVGPSGSGKSTLIDLIPLLRVATEGTITISGVDITRYKLKSIRMLISYVPQSPQIFNGTIKDHITYGKADATEAEVLEAIRLSGLESFISYLPYGLDTVVGEDAVSLSGGQRQRLDIAKALVEKAKILILDEPTSSLDLESVREFRYVLTKIQKKEDTTIVIVSHSLKGIIGADQIVVINKGMIESRGTHAELLEHKGWYADAWEGDKIL
jgi:ABC-type multidrug transport system fused ATPase/permease subunit